MQQTHDRRCRRPLSCSSSLVEPPVESSRPLPHASVRLEAHAYDARRCARDFQPTKRSAFLPTPAVWSPHGFETPGGKRSATPKLMPAAVHNLRRCWCGAGVGVYGNHCVAEAFSPLSSLPRTGDMKVLGALAGPRFREGRGRRDAMQSMRLVCYLPLVSRVEVQLAVEC